MNRALELMDGFPTHQKSIDGAAKRGLGGIVAQVYGVPKLTEVRERGMGSAASGGGAQSLERIGRRGVAILDGCGQMDDVVVFGVDELQIDIAPQRLFQQWHLRPAARHMQPLTSHIVLARAKVKSKDFAEPMADEGEAVGVHGKLADRADPLSQYPFDGSSGLTVQQRQGLIVRDTPLVQDGLIDAHAVHSALGIDAGAIEVLAGIQAHQIRGGSVPRTPLIDDGMAACEFHYCLIGRSQSGLGFE